MQITSSYQVRTVRCSVSLDDTVRIYQPALSYLIGIVNDNWDAVRSILTVAALALYPENPAETEKMLDFLRGPRPLNGIDKQFIRDRFRGKEYLMRSYLVGSTPENNYTPVQPYRVAVSENTYSRTQFVDGYLTLYVACSGADRPRPLKLRNKPSTGQWFLWEQQLLTGIRIPQVADPWA